MEKVLNCCPLCGGKLEYCNLMQYSEIYKILKSGRMSKRRIRKEDNGPMECGFISCTECEFTTDTDLRYERREKRIDIQQDNGKYYYDED